MELGRFNQLDGRWLSESQGMTHCFSVASVLYIEMELAAPTAPSCSMRGFTRTLPVWASTPTSRVTRPPLRLCRERGRPLLSGNDSRVPSARNQLMALGDERGRYSSC